MTLTSKEFAIEAHGDQRYGDLPYEFHLEMVASIIRKYFDGHVHLESLIDVAYLHDTREDTDVTLEELVSTFGVTVAYAVDLLSDEDGKNRKERKLRTYRNFTERIQSLMMIKPLAATIKFADRLANLTHSVNQIKEMDAGKAKDKSIKKLKMYESEHAEFVRVYEGFVLSEQLRQDVINFDFSV